MSYNINNKICNKLVCSCYTCSFNEMNKIGDCSCSNPLKKGDPYYKTPCNVHVMFMLLLVITIQLINVYHMSLNGLGL